MAFVLNVNLSPVEYRGMQTGVSSQTGKPWMSLVFEDADTNQVSVSVPQDMQGDVYNVGLQKGDYCAVGIRAVARVDGNSYIQLSAVPEILEEID